MQLDEFLSAVVTTEEGFFCLSLANPAGTQWADQWYIWPHDKELIIEEVRKQASSYNVYFSSYLFSAQRRIKANVLPSRTIHADLDEASLDTLPITPSIVVESSPGRHQAFWILDTTLPLDEHETLSRKITYAIEKADHAGWAIGRTARLPETVNYKYLDGPKPVRIIQSSLAVHAITQFELLPDDARPNVQEDEDWIASTKPIPIKGPNEILQTLANDKKITATLVSKFGQAQKDRSAALWALMLGLFRAGLDRDTVYFIASKSVNNKFSGMRYNGDRELSKDVLRAQAVALRKIPDPRQAVRELRKMGGGFMGKQAIMNIVMEVMRAEGDFFHTRDNSLWYVKRDIGRPIAVARVSDVLNSLLDVQFGLNPSEVEHNYVKLGLINHVVALPDSALLGLLSAYLPQSNTVLLHGGSREVYQIDAQKVTKVYNGAGGYVFLWRTATEPFVPDLSPDPLNGVAWHKIMFDGAFDNVINMSPDQAMALMRIWVHFIILRTAAYTRPILAFFGSPASGKSTVMRRLYRLLYGSRRELMSLSTPENFDLATTNDPFLVLDNVDTWEKWLPDRLAVAISNVDIDRRKLYSDADQVTWTRQAVIGVTAHNPKFGREDVSDRLLLLTFERLPEFANEGEIHERILKNRNKLWGAIINEQQAILAQPPIASEDAPHFRIKDFAILGLRIARALGVEAEFRGALQHVAIEQRLFSLEEDNILVTALKTMVMKDQENNQPGKERSVGLLWANLEMHSGNAQAFTHVYRNANTLGKKLLAMQEPLSELFNLSHRFDATSIRVWKFELRNGVIDYDTKHN